MAGILHKTRECLEDIKAIAVIVIALMGMLTATYQKKVEAEQEVVHTRKQVTAVAQAYTVEACTTVSAEPSEQCVQMVRELRGIVEEWHK